MAVEKGGGGAVVGRHDVPLGSAVVAQCGAMMRAASGGRARHARCSGMGGARDMEEEKAADGWRAPASGGARAPPLAAARRRRSSPAADTAAASSLRCCARAAPSSSTTDVAARCSLFSRY